jgi:hypothetical protein
MRETDIALLSASAQLPILEAKIRQCEAEAAIFKRDARVPFNEDTHTFLDTSEALRAIQKGHRVTWQIHPRLNADDVLLTWNAIQAELDELKAERDKLLILIAGENR